MDSNQRSDGVRVRCLTAWRYPYKTTNVLYQIEKNFTSKFKRVFNIAVILLNHILLIQQKIGPIKPKGSARTDLVRAKGLASLEPPAKQSTGLFFRFQRTRN